MNIAVCCDEIFKEELLSAWQVGCENVIYIPCEMDVMAYALAQYPIDIAVIALEGEGGMRSCEHIRKWFKEIPIIWVSDDESYEEISKQMKVYDFFVKPFPMKWLGNCIRGLQERVDK